MKSFLKYLAAFGAGGLAGHAVAGKGAEGEMGDLEKNLPVDVEQITSAVSRVRNRSEEATIRVGAARYLCFVCTKRLRHHLTAPALRTSVTAAFTEALKDRHESVRGAAERGLDLLKGWSPKATEEIEANLRFKMWLLEKHVALSPGERKEIIRKSPDQSHFVSRERLLDFMGAGKLDLEKSGKSEKEVQDFFIWLGYLSDKERDYLSLLCTEVDSADRTHSLPGFVHVLERLRISS